VKLSKALQIVPGDVVAFVGGGGKTTAMFRLAAEIVSSRGRVLTTTTTRIFAAQIRLAPVHVQSVPALLEALDTSPHVLLTGEVDADSGKAFGVPSEAISNLQSLIFNNQSPITNILIEADGSRMRPFKAPADHEPVIPDCTTLVVPVIGIDALGKPLDERHVHRPELVARLVDPSGLTDPKGLVVTPEIVARVIASPLGGRKAVPGGARVVVLINKVETEEQMRMAGHLADLLRAMPGIDGVIIGAVAEPDPIRA
jgi:molybdenum cofactor cytidylyltransferase